MTNKKTAKTKTVKDYLRLPFEVHYHRLSYTSLELLSEDYKITQPNNIKGIWVEQGNARGVTFYCAENTGAELMCCLTASHEQTVPVWLSMIGEEDLNINYGQKIGIEIDGNSLNVIEADPDDLEEFVESGYRTEFYSLEEESIDYIILDADGDRIEIDEYGCELDFDSDENDEGELIIDVEKLSEEESISNYSTMSHLEDIDMWIIEVWVEKFPTLPVPVPNISSYDF